MGNEKGNELHTHEGSKIIKTENGDIGYEDEGNFKDNEFENNLASNVAVTDIVMDDIVNEMDTKGNIIDDVDDIHNEDVSDDSKIIDGVNDNFLKVSSGSLITKRDDEPESVEILLQDDVSDDDTEYDYQ